MKHLKSLIIALFLISVNNAYAGFTILKGVHLTVKNNSRSTIKFLSAEGEGEKYDIPKYDINIGQSVSYKIKPKYKGLYGLASEVNYTMKFYPDSKEKGQIEIKLENPIIGSSRYYANATAPWFVNVNYINTNGNSEYQLVEVIISGGTDFNACNGVVLSIDSFEKNNTISGLIKYKKSEIEPLDNDISKLFTAKATSYKKFSVCKYGTQIFYNSQGYFSNYQEIGNVSFAKFGEQGDYIIYKYTISNLPEQVPITFDIQVYQNKWKNTPQNQKPNINYEFYTLITQQGNSENITLSKNSIHTVNFEIEGIWGDKNADMTGLPQNISERIANSKYNKVNPSNFLIKEVIMNDKLDKTINRKQKDIFKINRTRRIK